ncbi:MAG: biotin/lipoyl-binding protein, partial [Bacteroidia bacterium]|nr:biotin/lipoyl-binding protein [Bacteroidia bacterium]
MKKITATFILALVLASCGGGEKDKSAQIAEMETQLGDKKNAMADMKAEIEKMESEIAKLKGKAEETGIPVEIMKLVATPFKNYLEVMGRVDAEENVNLSSEMMGTVIRINVKPGDVVSKGQILAETDNQALVQSVADLQINLDLINTLFEKQKSLWDQKIGTEV